ncbi:unnamed protein product [Albugo candida]|uniref:Prefoldin subunit 1 n=1 Tax=Albugo candida TaxID=65357 RepID=A0A024GDS9_9STRA|nr:unnamed protein product [Albugo candida]|eukprot:CCI45026.1 unnamed protein product [Albugo candida]
MTAKWKEMHRASTLDKQIRELQVALSELDTVRPGKQTFIQRGRILFVEKAEIIANIKKGEC